ncbi:guanylate cyclase soluble subunit beta-2-like [Babylonia areolata]|uniref:guanylate cyclase soluble subunit beta-2-like n=1 Tax=Babylonia areolata TaxID=304850 RepID=UPI003FD683A7
MSVPPEMAQTFMNFTSIEDCRHPREGGTRPLLQERTRRAGGSHPHYGQVHCIIREMLQIKFGMERWYEVLYSSGMDEAAHFQVFKVYEDATTFKLIESVTEVLGVPQETVLKEFGTYFLTYCLKHGYDTMLLTLGQDLYSFINNLDSLHSMLSLSYRGLVAPSFRCEENEDGSLSVHHCSWRNGLIPIVTGLVEAVAKELFNQVAKMTANETMQIEVDTNKYMYHTIVRVDLQNRNRGGGLVSGKSYNPNKPRIARCRPSIDAELAALATKTPIITSEDLSIAFPYHLLIDESLHVIQCGESLREMVPKPINSDTMLTQFATISLPIMAPTAKNIKSFINSVFYLSIDTGDSKPHFVLKGQFMWLTNCSCLLFMGSPHLLSWNDFKEMNVSMADIPLYDCTRELVLLNQQRIAEIDVAKKLDETTLEFKRMSQALEAEKQKTEELLHEMMPRKVAMQLTLYGRVKAEKYDSCTVLFSDIVTFTDITGMCQADQVVNMLNDMYHRFDTHTEAHDVYKVETIGDAYMAVTGVPEVQEDHAERMADFAMDMLEEAGLVHSPATGLPLQIRVGLHTGAVVAGVIGKKKPRFDIYGDTVNTASLMESNGMAGRIQVSEPTFEKLYSRGYVFKCRGETEIKGKGKMVTYFLVGTLDRDLEQPDDTFSSLPDVLDPEAETHPSRKKIVRRTLPPTPKAINIVDNRMAHKQSLTLSGKASQANQVPRRSMARKSMPSPPPSSPTDLETPDHYSTTWNLSPPPQSAFADTSPAVVDTSPAVADTRPAVADTRPAVADSTPVVRKESPFAAAPPPQKKTEVVASTAEAPRKASAKTVRSPPRRSISPFGSSKAPAVLKKIEPSPFLKKKRHTVKPKKMEVYTTQQMNLLPFGGTGEDSDSSGSIVHNVFSKKGCTVL